ncbi:kinesin-like protein KIN-10B isoform X2 [Vicia villosa]|uniref:kinesin-like protein KIN-10B isoform X2 n=1 Tax=Vicia villosa TaxID=3911 RepID=UPI00273CBA72|nr:kinesin-like protein KIN-10B isoform X2 [Vicia villosa]
MAATSLCHPSNDPKTPNKPSNNPTSVSNVRVIVRVRPFLPQEFTSNNNRVSCISLLDHQDSQSQDEVAVYLKDPYTSRSECYQLDSFYDQEDDNVFRIFETEVSPMMPHIFNGCNATVFAYGATGSGKTYTMQGTEEHPGLIPLAMSNIIYMCQSTGSTAHLSFYEVYMDRCYDLLELKATEISVLDDQDGQIHLRGLSQVPVRTMSEFLDVFASGVQRRKVAHTALNDVSSRSHAVFVISVVSTPDETGRSVCGKLNLIDLAGNEDNRRSCNEGIRLQESTKINQSLFALSNVIYALNNNQPRIPYRESKLTRILQDSLGGTSRALMVACLNPGEYQESVNTVGLAARSRHVSNFVPSAHKLETPKANVDMEAKLRSWLESKGKAKASQQRLGPFKSPIMKKTPGSIMTSAKKSVTFCTSVKMERTSINQDAQNTTESRTFADSFRNLMDDEAAFDSFNEDNDRREIEHEVNKAALETHRNLPVEPLSNGVNSQITNMSKDAVLQSPLSKGVNSPIANVSKDAVLQSPLSQGVNLPIANVSKDAVLQSPLKEALTPINTNSTLTQTPFSATSTNNGLQQNETPLDKFSARSSAIKKCLVQEYIDLLNNASREELLELKGIGEKRAEYIIELREESPLKSLSDLEKIGLSLKQAKNLFTKSAKKLFEHKEEDSTMD